MKLPVPLRPLLALSAVQLLFGAHPVIAKLAFPAFGPGGVALARVLGAAVVLQIVRIVRKEPSLDLRTHLRIGVAAFFGIVSNQLLYIYGLAQTTVTHASLLIVTVPVATLCVAILAGRERASALRVGGIVVALCGAASVVAHRGSLDGGGLTGDLMILANAVAYAIYLVLGRDLVATLSPWTLGAWLFTWGVPMVLIVTGVPTIGEANAYAWMALTFVVLGSTVGTYVLNLVALRTVPASVVAVFVCLQPTIAAALALPLLGETLDTWSVVAGIVTIVGMLLATRG